MEAIAYKLELALTKAINLKLKKVWKKQEMVERQKTETIIVKQRRN